MKKKKAVKKTTTGVVFSFRLANPVAAKLRKVAVINETTMTHVIESLIVAAYKMREINAKRT